MTRATPASTYDDDFFAWTQEQAAALREAPAHILPRIDFEHLSEEIADLGKRDLREVGSFLELVLAHLIKIDAGPTSPDARHWRSETRAVQRSARKAFSPGMRQHLDVSEIWRDVRKAEQDDRRDAGLTLSAPATCPLTLDDLLERDFDLDGALARLASAPRSG